jgi:hypothetical protein
MSKRDDYMKMIANQMMKGPRRGRVPGTKLQHEYFFKRHKNQIGWVHDRLPRCSAAVGAVVMKCLIKYGEEKVARFCDALRNQNFNGVDDPAHHLWLFLLKSSRKETIEIYQKALYAAKAYMEDRPIKEVRPLLTDVFEWDEGFTVPDEFLANWKPDEAKWSRVS